MTLDELNGYHTVVRRSLNEEQTKFETELYSLREMARELDSEVEDRMLVTGSAKKIISDLEDWLDHDKWEVAAQDSIELIEAANIPDDEVMLLYIDLMGPNTIIRDFEEARELAFSYESWCALREWEGAPRDA